MGLPRCSEPCCKAQNSHFCALQGSGTDGRVYRVMLAAFGPSLGAAVASGAQLQLAAASPPDACTPLVRPGAAAGKVLLVQRGNCSPTVKVCCLAHEHASSGPGAKRGSVDAM